MHRLHRLCLPVCPIPSWYLFRRLLCCLAPVIGALRPLLIACPLLDSRLLLSRLLFPFQAAQSRHTEEYPGAPVSISVMQPMPQEWWLRPVSSAWHVGEQRAGSMEPIVLQSSSCELFGVQCLARPTDQRAEHIGEGSLGRGLPCHPLRGFLQRLGYVVGNYRDRRRWVHSQKTGHDSNHELPAMRRHLRATCGPGRGEGRACLADAVKVSTRGPGSKAPG